MSRKRNPVARDTENGSGLRHGAVSLLVAQLIGRGLVHYGIPLPAGAVLESAELAIDLASGAAAVAGYGLGYLWRRYIVRSAPAEGSIASR